jgi:hypothetical protein
MAKTRDEIRLGWFNLILTALIGIGMALFLNWRDAQLKTQLTERAAQLRKGLEVFKAELDRPVLMYRITLGSAQRRLPKRLGRIPSRPPNP